MTKPIIITISLIFTIVTVFAQCVTPDVDLSSNPNIFYEASANTYNINCAAGSVDIFSTTYNPGVISSSQIEWTNGEIGDFTFNPNCNNIGCFDFVPCVPALTSLPLQCVDFASLGVATSGSVVAGGSSTVTFSISDFCYASGANYDGQLGINMSGSGSVDLSLVQPDGTAVGPLTFDISLINLLSPISVDLLGLTISPNGTWQIIIADAGAGAFSYTIDPTSEICIESYVTSNISCGEAVTVCVEEGCPSFNNAYPEESTVCSGEDVGLISEFSPANSNDIAYFWTGPGINLANETMANPTVNLTNTSCAAITETFTLSANCISDGSTIINNFSFDVIVYPEIDPASVVIDNYSNIIDPLCLTSVSYPVCPNFSISGNSYFSAGDNGTNADFTIENGNPKCTESIKVTITCLNDCSPANLDITVNDCDVNDEFSITADLNSPGDAIDPYLVFSDGSSSSLLGDTVFTFGNFSSGEILNIKIVDYENELCNVNLGNYTANCAVCPNITSVNTVNAAYCENEIINLIANIDSGTEGVDYSIQWFANNLAIAGANTSNFNYLAQSSNRCNNTDIIFTAKLTCLNAGTESTVNELSSQMVSIFPVPVLGLDFYFDKCNVVPIDNCNGDLLISTNNVSSPSPGNSVTVDYTAGLYNAPYNCSAIGSVVVDCPLCTDYPGNSLVNSNTVCFGESIDLTNSNALVTSPGYEVGYVITTAHPSGYANTNDLLNASIISPQGPFPSPGTIPPGSITNDGSLINVSTSCGQLLYFTPFLSFNCNSYQALFESGTIYTPAPGSITEPGVGGQTFAFPDVPYCAGLSSYNIYVCVEDNTVDTFDPLSSTAFLGLVDNLPGGIYSNFPGIDDKHDSCIEGLFGVGCDPQCYFQNNWTQDPSGEIITITTQNVFNILLYGNGTDELGYALSLNVNCNNVGPFPNPCNDCDVIGNTVAVNFLPDVNLGPIQPIPFICEGESLDLTQYNPSVNITGNGAFIWTNETGNPYSIADPTEVIPALGLNSYCVSYNFCNANNCNSNKVCTNVLVNAIPGINPVQNETICQGEDFDLTALESGIGNNGTITWTVGGSLDNGGAILNDPANIIPIGSEQYCANFVNNLSGCVAETCLMFNYNSNPTILSVPIIEECVGTDINLTDYNLLINVNKGLFKWYDQDPDLGALPLTNTTILSWDPLLDGNTFYVTYTNNLGCTAKAQVMLSDANCCTEIIVHQEPFTPDTIIYEVSDYIESTLLIEANEEVIYQAENYILLNSGFTVEQNAVFDAIIEVCDPD